MQKYLLTIAFVAILAISKAENTNLNPMLETDPSENVAANDEFIKELLALLNNIEIAESFNAAEAAKNEMMKEDKENDEDDKYEENAEESSEVGKVDEDSKKESSEESEEDVDEDAEEGKINDDENKSAEESNENEDSEESSSDESEEDSGDESTFSEEIERDLDEDQFENAEKASIDDDTKHEEMDLLESRAFNDENDEETEEEILANELCMPRLCPRIFIPICAIIDGEMKTFASPCLYSNKARCGALVNERLGRAVPMARVLYAGPCKSDNEEISA